MAGQRRYGTTKVGKLAGLRGNGDEANAAAKPRGQSKIPVLLSSGEQRRERGVPHEKRPLLSEREPLLLGSGSDRDAGGRRGNGGGGASSESAFAPGSSRRDNGKALTSLLVLNYMIGSGILNAPQVFQASGIGPATILYIIAGERRLCIASNSVALCVRIVMQERCACVRPLFLAHGIPDCPERRTIRPTLPSECYYLPGVQSTVI